MPNRCDSFRRKGRIAPGAVPGRNGGSAISETTARWCKGEDAKRFPGARVAADRWTLAAEAAGEPDAGIRILHGLRWGPKALPGGGKLTVRAPTPGRKATMPSSAGAP